MWIKEMPSELHESNSIGVNFYTGRTKFTSWIITYVPLGVGFNILTYTKSIILFTLITIMTSQAIQTESKARLPKKIVQLHQLSFDEYRNLKFKVEV